MVIRSIISVRDESTTDIIRLPQFNMVPFTNSDGTIDSSANSEDAAWVCTRWFGLVAELLQTVYECPLG